MSWISEAHSQWHAVHGAYATCPLDCGAMSPEAREAEDLINALEYEDREGEKRIRCAHCKGRHVTVDAVRLCGDLEALRARRDTEPEPEPLTYATAIGYTGECEGTERCDVYTRCKKHRQQDADRGVPNAHFKAYND